MAKKRRDGSDAKEKKMSLRMKRFVDGVIQQVEEAGIDDEYAVKETDERASARVTSAVAVSRPRRQRSA